MQSKLRIPGATAVSLVLGSACGGDGDSNGSINTSSSRISKLAEDYCAAYAECYPEDFAAYYADHADCVAQFEEDADAYSESYSEECADALLDLVECGNEKLECEEAFEPKCTKESNRAKELCGEQVQKAARRARILRIPD